jgi:hypothetical protein
MASTQRGKNRYEQHTKEASIAVKILELINGMTVGEIDRVFINLDRILDKKIRLRLSPKQIEKTKKEESVSTQ